MHLCVYVGRKRILGHYAVEQNFVGRVKDHEPTAATGEEFKGLHVVCVLRSPVSEALHYAWQLFGRNRRQKLGDYYESH